MSDWYFVECGSTAFMKEHFSKQRVTYPLIGFERISIIHRQLRGYDLGGQYHNGFCNLRTGCTTLANRNEADLAYLKTSDIGCGLAGSYSDVQKEKIVNQFSKLKKQISERKQYSKPFNKQLLKCVELLLESDVEWYDDGDVWKPLEGNQNMPKGSV